MTLELVTRVQLWIHKNSKTDSRLAILCKLVGTVSMTRYMPCKIVTIAIAALHVGTASIAAETLSLKATVLKDCSVSIDRSFPNSNMTLVNGDTGAVESLQEAMNAEGYPIVVNDDAFILPFAVAESFYKECGFHQRVLFGERDYSGELAYYVFDSTEAYSNLSREILRCGALSRNRGSAEEIDRELDKIYGDDHCQGYPLMPENLPARVVAPRSVQPKIESPQERMHEKAVKLGLEIEIFYHCPCGEALADIPLSGELWETDSLELATAYSSCILRSVGSEKPNALVAMGSAGGGQTNCWISLGSSSPDTKHYFRPSTTPPFEEGKLHSCFKIIEAKARHWFSQGNAVSLAKKQKNGSVDRSPVASKDELTCFFNPG